MAYASPAGDSLQAGSVAEEALWPQADVDVSTLTPVKAHDAMIDLKCNDAYKEGVTWTNYEFYGGSSPSY